MKNIEQVYKIDSPAAKVWKALVDPKIIDKWGGGPASMNDKLGTRFTLWGGDIHGKNIEVVQNKKLVQDWFSGNWGKSTKVTFTLIEKGNNTELHLLHENVPDEEAKDIADGWKSYYIGPLKKLLESKF